MSHNKLLCRDGDRKIFLSYVGIVTQSIISGLIDVLEKIEDCEVATFSNRLYVAFVEMAQNIMHYSMKNRNHYKSYILIGEDEQYKQFYIVTQNIISSKDKNRLENLLKEISSLNKEDIKKLYRERRRNGKKQHQQGAGIGLLDIAKSSDKIKFDIVPFENTNYLFTLEIYIKNRSSNLR